MRLLCHKSRASINIGYPLKWNVLHTTTDCVLNLALNLANDSKHVCAVVVEHFEELMLKLLYPEKFDEMVKGREQHHYLAEINL